MLKNRTKIESKTERHDRVLATIRYFSQEPSAQKALRDRFNMRKETRVEKRVEDAELKRQLEREINQQRYAEKPPEEKALYDKVEELFKQIDRTAKTKFRTRNRSEKDQEKTDAGRPTSPGY